MESLEVDWYCRDGENLSENSNSALSNVIHSCHLMYNGVCKEILVLFATQSYNKT